MGSPFSRGLGGPAFGQAEVPHLLPSWPLQSPGQFLTSPESDVDWAFRPRCLVQAQMLSWICLVRLPMSESGSQINPRSQVQSGPIRVLILLGACSGPALILVWDLS